MAGVVAVGFELFGLSVVEVEVAGDVAGDVGDVVGEASEVIPVGKGTHSTLCVVMVLVPVPISVSVLVTREGVR